MAKKRSNNFLVQGGILAIASIISRIIGLIYRVPLNNIIGDEGMGYYSNAYYIYNLGLIISSYSLPLAVSKLVAARTIKKEYKNSYRMFLCALSFAVISGLLISLIIFFGADFLATVMYKSPRSAIPLRVLAPTIFVFAIMGVLRGFYQGKNTMVPTSISQLIEQIVNALVSVYAAYYLMNKNNLSEDIAAYGAAGGTLGTFAGTLIALLFLAFVFSLYKPTLDKQLRRDEDRNKETMKELYPALIVTIIPVILGQTVYQLSSIIDGSIFGHVMAAKGFDEESKGVLWGIYTGKYNLLINVPVSIASAMAVAIIPSIVASKTNGMIHDVKQKVHSAVKLNMLIAIPSAVGLAVLASPILQLLFRDNRDLPANLIRYGSVAVIFFALSTITNAVLQGINQMRLPVIHSAISLGIHIVLVFLLLKFTNLDTYVLIIGNVTFALLVCVLNWLAVAKHLNYKQEIMKTFLMPGGCAAVMGIFTFLSYKGTYLLVKMNSVSTLVSLIVSVIIYGFLLVITKTITKEELYRIPMGGKIVSLLEWIHLI